jgi:hypothetical protein
VLEKLQEAGTENGLPQKEKHKTANGFDYHVTMIGSGFGSES